jgi:hypothetical protein
MDMRLTENERARWQRDGLLHLRNLLPAVARKRLRRWVAAANGGEAPPSLASGTLGFSALSAASLAKNHAGLSRLLEGGLMPGLASQLLGAPVCPADVPDNPTLRQVTCVVALNEDSGEPLEVMVGRHFGPKADPRGAWQSIRAEPGDLIWLHGLTPRRGLPTQALILEYRALSTQVTRRPEQAHLAPA